jgi:hypothetical protein
LRNEQRKFDKTMKTLDEGFEFLDTKIDPMLATAEETKWRKNKQLFEQWSNEVFSPIKSQIKEQLANLTSKQISQRKRELFQEFIDASNGKFLFRDVPHETYDAFKAQKDVLKYKTGHLKDPLKKHAKAKKREARMSAMKAGPSGRTRNITDLKTWPKYQDTTAGRLENQPTKPIDKNARPGCMGQTHYQTSKDQALVKKEWFSGGRKSFHGKDSSNIPGLSTKWGT